MDEQKPPVSEPADPRLIEAATAAIVSAIEWDIGIAAENSRHSDWLTAFCTAGLALLVTQTDKLAEPGTLPSYAVASGLTVITLLFIAGGILGGIMRRRIKRGMELKRQQNSFFLKQKAVALANPKLTQDSPLLLERLWQLRFLPEAERVEYLDVSRRDVADQSEKKLIPLQELLTLTGYLILVMLILLRYFGNG